MCCGTPDTWREYRRQLGAIAVRERIRTALATLTPAAVVIAGDMNLVSGRSALDTLLHTLLSAPAASRLAPMVRADAFHSDGWTDWTWDGTGTPFNGGRLDNVLYSSGTLAVTHARVWDTEFLPADTLRAHQLTADMSKTINRHRPVVVDFRFSAPPVPPLP
jgi:endonuclease/exonuclease/phosphatase family metal-dependent hydrolase